MGKHSVTPHIPVSDSERLIQASQILKACIVANDTSHPFEINPSYTLETVYCLVQDVIEHRGNRTRKRPGEAPTSITGRLQQAASILTLCIISYDTDPSFDHGFDFSYPLHIVVALIDEAQVRLSEEMDKRLRERPPKLERRALEFLRASRAAVTPDSSEGKPN